MTATGEGATKRGGNRAEDENQRSRRNDVLWSSPAGYEVKGIQW